MTAIASPEFVSPEFAALCQAQLRLLTQHLSARLPVRLSGHLSGIATALYIADMTEPGGEQSNFVPVVSYPESVESWIENFEQTTTPRAWPSDYLGERLGLPMSEALLPSAEANSTEAQIADDALRSPEQQLVMPMVYTDVVVGLLVAVRPEGNWNSQERQHIEQVAQSLAGGCVLERRNQWLQRQIAQKNGLQSRQSEIFHNLLHQFRNPLTAVSTFGQLLVKRIEPGDPNQPIATGIVRENKRLRELVTHFDEAVAIGDADLTAQQPVIKPIPRLLASEQPLLLAEDQSGLASAENWDKNWDSSEGQGLGQPLTLSAQYLPDIVGPVLAVTGITAAEKGVTLHQQVAADTPFVWGEEEALYEVVTNLVDNAIKYSAGQQQPQVWVQTGVSRMAKSGEPAGHYQGIVVGDTGPGIPEEDLARLFERNYRGVQAKGDIPGTGLGLAIARSLVAEMHGCIEVISPAVGTPWMPNLEMPKDSSQAQTGPGTVFIVWLLELDRVT